MTLPINITPKIFLYPPKPKIKCPTTQNIDVKIRAIRAPYLSIIMPPINGMMMFGNA